MHKRDECESLTAASTRAKALRGAVTDLALCICRLQMRELYCWEQGRAALQPLPHKAIAGGPAGRAVLWASLEQRDDVPLLLDAGDNDPFVCAAPAVLSAVG